LEGGNRMNTDRLFLSFVMLVLFLAPSFISGEATAGELHLYAGAGLRQPTDTLVQGFEKQTGARVYVDYGGGGQLLTRILISGKGDLFMPGAFFYIEKLQHQGLIHSYRPVVAHTPVIGVNSKKANIITTFEDLARPGIRLAMGDPKAMAFGRTAMDILDRSGLKQEILGNVVVYGATVKQLALYVAGGDVDASIIGRTDAFQYKDHITIVQLPDRLFRPETIAIAVLHSSNDLPLSQKLRDFMSTHEAIQVFQGFGFIPLREVSR
jgi:molybdate transport system substrate-binding protein